jgi:hypothetical protein
MGPDSIVAIVTDTGWTLWRWNSGGCNIFCTHPDWRWTPRSFLLYKEYQVCFPGGKAARAWCWPPTSSSAEVKERVGLHLYSTSRPPWPILGWTLSFTTEVVLQYTHTNLPIARHIKHMQLQAVAHFWWQVLKFVVSQRKNSKLWETA